MGLLHTVLPNEQVTDSRESSYIQQRNLLIQNIKKLPLTELHYYFALLVSSIENEENSPKYIELIENANAVIEKLNQFYTDATTNPTPDLSEVTSALNALILSTNLQSTQHKVKMAALALCSAILGFAFGVVGAASGLLGGLISDYTLIGNVRGAGFGFLSGLALGALAGSRLPNLLFQSAFERKLEFCINSMVKVGKELATRKPFSEYEAATKKYILEVFFKDTPESEKETAFAEFLRSNNQSYQVSTITAGFVSPALKGHLGHHFLISFSINGKKDIPIEYGDRIKTPSFFDQNEEARVVTGQKLFEMLVFDRILQETHEYNMINYSKNYDLGSNDCRSYIDKVLVCTGQAPTQIKRFNPTYDKWTGTNIIGPIVRFFSKTQEQELKPIIPFYKQELNDPDPVIIATKWTGKM